MRDVPSWDETLTRSKAYFPENAKILEIGAGTGSTALRIYEAAAQYRATDISSEMIEIAQKKAEAIEASRLEFEAAEIFAEPAGVYDVVLAYNLLHLVPDVTAAVRAVHATLKTGGLFISKSGCLSGKYAMLRAPIAVMQWVGKAPRTVNYFSPSKLNATIRAAGFEILESEALPKGSMVQFVVARKI